MDAVTSFISRAHQCLIRPPGYHGWFFRPDYLRAAQFYELAAELSTGDFRGELYEEVANCLELLGQEYLRRGMTVEEIRLGYPWMQAYLNAAGAFGQTHRAIQCLERGMEKNSMKPVKYIPSGAGARFAEAAIEIHMVLGERKQAREKLQFIQRQHALILGSLGRKE